MTILKRLPFIIAVSGVILSIEIHAEAQPATTAAGLVSSTASLTECDLPVSSINDYLPRAQKVTSAEIERFAGKNLRADDASIVIVGDLRQFKTDLKSRFPNAQIILVDKLDLNNGSLVKP
jgi:hypothetical protein